MDVQFDPVKDDVNLTKHGLPPSAALRMDMEAATIIPDERFDYGERRFWAVGPIGGQLHVLSFTWRGECLRAISLRKANSRERKRYGTPI